MADAMSCCAYPASKSFQDVSMHGTSLSKIKIEREIHLERQRERGRAPQVPGEVHLPCQALSLEVSRGGVAAHLEETLDGLPIREGDNSDLHWIEPEPPAAQVTLQETRPKQGEPDSPPSLETSPLLVQTNTVSTSTTGSEHVR